MSDNIELHEDPANIVQGLVADPAPIEPLPVTAVDPVRTIALPAKAAGWKRFPLSSTIGAVKILDRDPRRKRAVIVGFDTANASDGINLGGSQAEAAGAMSFLLPFGAATAAAGNASTDPIEITSIDEVWAFTSDATTVSVYNEQWAD